MAKQETKQETSKIDELRNALGNVRNSEKEAHKALEGLKKDLRSVDARLKYDEANDDLRVERQAVVDALAEKEMAIQELEANREQAQHDFEQEQVRIAQQQMLEQSAQYTFGVPDDNPVIACQVLAAIAGSLQWQFCSSRSYYEYLLTEQFKAREDDGESTVETPYQSKAEQLQEQVDEIRQRREYLQALRFAVERDFNKMAEHIPPDSTFKPRLLNKSDGEVYRMLEERQEQRIQQMREQRERTREMVQHFGKTVEDAAYQPGVVTH